MDLSGSEILFYGGIIVASAAAIIGIAALVVLCIARKRLNRKLEMEYGKKRT